MVGHQRLPWINNPTSGSISVTSAKQDQEIPSDRLSTSKKVACPHFGPVVGLSALCLLLLVACVALSVLYNNESYRKPAWKSLLFDFQNISDSYLALQTANNDLRRDNELLKERGAWLQQQTDLLNRTAADLMSVHLALSLESSELTEQIVNLTSTNLHLTRERERLVQYASEQDGERLNMSETIKHLVDSNAQREEEGRRFSEVNGRLRDELVQAKEQNQQLLEINDKFQGEVKNLSEKIAALLKDDCESSVQQLHQRLTELREQKQNLSSVLMKERREASEQETEMLSVQEAFSALDLYCPVVNHNTKERICRKCPDSWTLFETKCYYFSPRVLTWSSSRAWCRTQGGDLLIINSVAEQRFVFESSRALEPSSRLWIGLTDAEEEGEWSWVDGSPVTADLQFWLSRPGLGAEPDDWKLDDPLGEDCGHLDTSEDALKSWMDGSCRSPYRWICEKNV